MGLSSYGKPKYYDLILDNLIDVKDDGSIHLNMEYFAFTYDKVMTNKKFSKLFGIEPKTKNEKTLQIHFDIGASAQKVLEDVILKMVNHIYAKTKMKISVLVEVLHLTVLQIIKYFLKVLLKIFTFLHLQVMQVVL